jgi:hypothetical protein
VNGGRKFNTRIVPLGPKYTYTARRDARGSVRKWQHYNSTLALRSAIVLAIEPRVNIKAYPEWPEFADKGRKFSFGWCPFPDRMTELNTYIRTATMTSPDDTRPVLVIDHIVRAIPANVAMVGRNNRHDAADNTIVDAPSGVQRATTAHDVPKKMVWTGYMRAQVVPTHLRGAPDQCSAYRRIVRDLGDSNKILDDNNTILHTPEHFARKLCDDPR